ncbi:alanine racemase [Georgenia thermotolerans]|uniref:alanine racemase n=1 Tax=Georgenia thermotolerans TaxID=527326 RepID=UPI002012E155|nr:alanine racemase [Georgenia thermotolerans]
MVDLGAIAANVRVLKRHVHPARLMAVVKADAYGHGLVPVARAALDAGADQLGAATLPEGFALRAAGITAPIMVWLTSPTEDYARAASEGLELGVHTVDQLAATAAAARAAGRTVPVHLKIETGMWRGGATREQWPAMMTAAHAEEQTGAIWVRGIYTHLARADEPGHSATVAQLRELKAVRELAARSGLRPEVVHAANSAAALATPEARLDMVRAGIAIYGLNPLLGIDPAVALRPAMTLEATLTSIKTAPASAGVSYGHTHVLKRRTHLGIVPLGYADGVPRAASNNGEVLVAGRRRPIVGRVCMDQVVVDLGQDPPEAPCGAVLFGSGSHGEPTAGEWAERTGTIHYEIVSRIGSRVPRVYRG